MRNAIILARKHGAKTLSVISGPEAPIHEQLSKFKSEFMTVGEHKDYAEVEIWTSDGGRRKLKRLKPVTKAAATTTAATAHPSHQNAPTKHFFKK